MPELSDSTRPNARVLADLISEAEQSGRGVRVLRQLGFPVLVRGKGLSLEDAGAIVIYPLGSMLQARLAAGRSPQLRLGRGEASDILLTSELSVSKRHAVFIGLGAEDWTLANLGRAATRVEGRALAPGEQVPLVDEVVGIEVGDGSAFTFFHRKGFVVLFRKLLAGRLGSKVAATTMEIQDQEAAPLSDTARVILDAAEAGQTARHFLVVLDNALLEEASNWRDLTDLVSELDQQIVKIEAKLPDGEKTVVFQR